MGLINIEKKQKKKNPLKRSKTGLEVELFLIDNKGDISYKGDDIFKKIQKRYPKIEIVKECGKNMIEIGCYPSVNSYNPALEIIDSIEHVIKVAKENNLHVYPFGTYPGNVEAKFTSDKSGRYKIKEKIFGKEKFALATKVIGFHHHYTLPRGIFNYETKNLKLLVNGKIKRSLLNSYNFQIAIEPILTLFTQSSPFFQSKLLAKDSRMLVYRGGKKLKYPGLYSKYQQLGALPPYKQTETDLIRSLKSRQIRWKNLIKKIDPNIDPDKLYACNLEISWNPIKINKHGTLESRGMDMNYMSVLLGVSSLIKFCLKKIQRDFIEVSPSDMGITDSFIIRKGILFVPPHTHVREVLQKASAYEGFKNKELYEYSKKFFRFAKYLVPDYYCPLLEKIESMIENRESVSDEITKFAKNKKLIDSRDKLSKKNARIISLHFSKKFEIDLKNTKKIVRIIMEKHKRLKK